MATKWLNVRSVMKHDTKANWSKAANFIPLAGEIIVYTDDNKIKIGNGVDKVGDLPFVSNNESGLQAEITRAKAAEQANADNIDTLTTTVTDGLSSVNSKITQLQTDTTNIDNKADNNSSSISLINGKITGINSSISNIISDVADLESDIKTNKSSISEVKEDVAGMVDDVDYVKKNKQNKLTAGDNITIDTDTDTISATVTWGTVTGTIDDQTDLVAKLDGAGHKVDLEFDNTTYELKAKLYDKNDNLISTSTIIDLPMDSMILDVTYDSTKKALVITLKDGSTREIPVTDLLSGLVTQDDLNTALATKQDNLVSGTNIKTINNESILGDGNLTIDTSSKVNDVQVDGVSVVTDKIANLTSTTFGKVKDVKIIKSKDGTASSVLDTDGNATIDLSDSEYAVYFDTEDEAETEEYVTASTLASGLAGKQNTLISGTNIKTIDGQSLVGAGNITVSEARFKDTDVYLTNLSLGNGLQIDDVATTADVTTGTLDIKLLTAADVVNMYSKDKEISNYLFVDSAALKQFQTLVKADIDSKTSISTLQYQIVDFLPEEPQEGIIYMKTSDTVSGVYDLYAYVTDTDGTKKLKKVGQTASDADEFIAKVREASDSTIAALEDGLTQVKTEKAKVDSIASTVQNTYAEFEELVTEANALKTIMEEGIEASDYLQTHLDEAKEIVTKINTLITLYNNITTAVDEFNTTYAEKMTAFETTYNEAIENITDNADRAQRAASKAEEVKDQLLEMSPFVYKGSVTTYDALPTSPKIGEYYTTEDTGDKWLWDGSKWIRTDRELTALEQTVATKADKTDITDLQELIATKADADDVNGKQDLITATNLLKSDLVTDENQVHKFITEAQSTKLNNVNLQYISTIVPGEEFDLSAISVPKGVASYGFIYNSDKKWLENQNCSANEESTYDEDTGMDIYPSDDTYSYGKFTFTAQADTTLTVKVYEYSEEGYDYGMLSKLDTELNYSTDGEEDDNNWVWTGKQDDYEEITDTITYNVTAGTHFITFKYRKDTSDYQNDDRFAITSIKLDDIGSKKVINYDTKEEIELAPDLTSDTAKEQLSTNFVTLDTAQTLTSKKVFSYNEEIKYGGQDSILKVLSQHKVSEITSQPMWAGRMLIGTLDKTFLLGVYHQNGTSTGICGIGAHTWTSAIEETGAAWEDIYLEPDGNKAVYIGGYGWRPSSGWLKVQNNNSSGASFRTYINSGTSTSPTWRTVLPNMSSSSYSVYLSPYISNNSAYGYCVSIGYNATPTSTYATNIGYSAVSGNYGTALGYSSKGSGSHAIGIGASAQATGSYSIQIGQGTNSTANTLNVGLSSSLNVQLLNSSGKIPSDRIPQLTDAQMPSGVAYTTDMLESLQPVGYVFVTTRSDFDPGDQWGGTWEEKENPFSFTAYVWEKTSYDDPE